MDDSKNAINQALETFAVKESELREIIENLRLSKEKELKDQEKQFLVMMKRKAAENDCLMVEIKKQCKGLMDELVKYKEQESALKASLSGSENTISEANAKMLQLRNQKEGLGREVTSLKKSQVHFEEVEQKLKSELTKLMCSLNPYKIK